MKRGQLYLLTTVTMLAFAGNSLFCRMALSTTRIDVATFTSVRLASGALMLWLIVRFTRGVQHLAGDWLSALALFIYAAALSFAYIHLSTATGALLLFGAVQATMIGRGLWLGERMHRWQWFGFILALGGLIGLLLPGLSAPPLGASLLMMGSGVAWGWYSLRGKGRGDPTCSTAGNFLRSVPMTVALSLLMLKQLSWDSTGVTYAILSGAITSGVGYAIWYTVLPQLQAAQAATLQLSVPVIAAFGGVLFLSEAISLRLVLASIAILGGVVLVIRQRYASGP